VNGTIDLITPTTVFHDKLIQATFGYAVTDALQCDRKGDYLTSCVFSACQTLHRHSDCSNTIGSSCSLLGKRRMFLKQHLEHLVRECACVIRI